MQKQIAEYHLTAYHEAGHVIVGECVGCRFLDIHIGYDPELGKFDGLTSTQCTTLDFHPKLLRTVAGDIAQIMREDEGRWDLRRIQDRILAGEFRDSKDSAKWHQLIDENGLTEQYAPELSSAIKDVFECLTSHWSVLDAIAQACIATYDPVKQKGWLPRDALPHEIQAQLDEMAETM